MSLSRNEHAGSMSAFVRRIDDFGVSDLPQATERAFFPTISLTKMPSTQLRLPRHQAILTCGRI